jgi:hypothetical protein
MFDITTSRDFLAKLEADFADYMKEQESARLALNCAITAYHIHEWVWGDWLKTDYVVWKKLGIRDLDSFLSWIDQECPQFATVQELTTGAKHFSRNGNFQALRVGAPPLILDCPDAGLDVGCLDGPMPFVAENHGKGYLLIDYGPGTGEYRWQPAVSVLRLVVQFWRKFFDLHAPPERTESASNLEQAP